MEMQQPYFDYFNVIHEKTIKLFLQKETKIHL